MTLPRSQLVLLVALSLFVLAATRCADADNQACRSGETLDADDHGAGEVSLLQHDIKLVNKVADAHSRTQDIQADANDADTRDEGAALLQTGMEVQEAIVERQVPEELVPTTTTISRDEMGYKLNKAGDLKAFIASLVIYPFGIICCVAFFMVARTRYPLTFQNNLALNLKPLDSIPEGTWGWMQASWSLTTEQVVENAGLDQAMLLEFMHMAMKITAIIGVPMFCIMGPVHYLFGGHAAGDDRLSYLSFGNVEDGSNLYWLHACLVWGVVAIVQISIFKAQEKFLPLRFQWLQELPNPRANTILVEGIPSEYQSDAALKGFFERVFVARNAITSTYVVRNAPELESKWNSREALRQELEKARFRAQRVDAVDEDKESVVALQDELAQLTKEVEQEQKMVKGKSSTIGPDGYHASAGFVSFKDRSDAVLALSMTLSKDTDEWEVSIPPEPVGVIWSDLQQGETSHAAFTFLGYALTAVLYMLYMPAVVGITQISTTINMGPFQAMWQSVAPTVGLQFMVAFLPTFLILIFRFCFTLKDDAWAQQMLQNWYTLFQVVFVVLVTAIGHEMVTFMKTLFTDPMQMFPLLGEALPPATHFYMNYLVLQWLSHAMVLTRYIPLAKWFVFRNMYDDETARQMSEPEDQDYYGMGSRTTRLTINLFIGIIYGTLSPPINLLAFVEFLVCRVIYGYLVVFAECRKPDLGGVFWVTQLRHVFIGNLIYCIVMTGVLLGRAATSGPGAIAASSMVYVVYSMRKFEKRFSWEKLPFIELKEENSKVKRKPDCGEYVQPFMK
jgi:hypothetical protein